MSTFIISFQKSQRASKKVAQWRKIGQSGHPARFETLLGTFYRFSLGTLLAGGTERAHKQKKPQKCHKATFNLKDN